MQPSRPAAAPSAEVLRAYAGRAARLWLGVRLALVAVLVLAASEAPAVAFELAPTAVIGIVLLCAVLGPLDARRRGERALLGNLGVGDRTLSAVFALTAAGGELLVAIVSAPT